MKETWYDKLFLEMWVTLPTIVLALLIGFIGITFQATIETIVRFIFGAVISIGVASLKGQAAGLGKIIDLLQETRN